MALGDAYATLDEAKTRGGIQDTNDDALITRALLVASRAVEEFCGRQFNDAGDVSARVFEPTSTRSAWVDDFSTATGLVVETDSGDGTYSTTLASSAFTLHPLNGVSTEGIPGFAYHRLRLADTSTCFRPNASPPSLRVTARWGWVAVPENVKEATLIVAAKVLGRKSSPHGAAVIGAGDFVFRISSQADPDAAMLLAPYRFKVPGIA